MVSKKILGILVLIVVLIVIGVLLFLPKPTPHPTDIEKTLLVNGQERRFLIHIPLTYSSTTHYPLLLEFHGGGGNAEAERNSKGTNLIADEKGFIVVYPQGATEDRLINSKGGTWNVGPLGGGYAFDANIDDIAFVKTMITYMQENYSIDRTKIYAAGLSMGGMISYKLACEMSDVFAAVAPVGTALTTIPCTPKRPISIIDFKGTNDKMIPFLGGPTDPSVPKVMVIGGPYLPHSEVIATWAKINSCQGNATTFFKGPETTCTIYEQCAQGAEVATCISEGAGHTWPGTKNVFDNTRLAEYSGTTAYDINATIVMWDFFMRHPLVTQVLIDQNVILYEKKDASGPCPTQGGCTSDTIVYASGRVVVNGVEKKALSSEALAALTTQLSSYKQLTHENCSGPEAMDYTVEYTINGKKIVDEFPTYTCFDILENIDAVVAIQIQ